MVRGAGRWGRCAGPHRARPAGRVRRRLELEVVAAREIRDECPLHGTILAAAVVNDRSRSRTAHPVYVRSIAAARASCADRVHRGRTGRRSALARRRRSGLRSPVEHRMPMRMICELVGVSDSGSGCASSSTASSSSTPLPNRYGGLCAVRPALGSGAGGGRGRAGAGTVAVLQLGRVAARPAQPGRRRMTAVDTTACAARTSGSCPWRSSAARPRIPRRPAPCSGRDAPSRARRAPRS